MKITYFACDGEYVTEEITKAEINLSCKVPGDWDGEKELVMACTRHKDNEYYLEAHEEFMVPVERIELIEG